MKKCHLAVIVTICPFLIMCACAQGSAHQKTLLVSDDHYKIYDVSEDGQPEYEYEIINRRGKIL